MRPLTRTMEGGFVGTLSELGNETGNEGTGSDLESDWERNHPDSGGRAGHPPQPSTKLAWILDGIIVRNRSSSAQDHIHPSGLSRACGMLPAGGPLWSCSIFRGGQYQTHPQVRACVHEIFITIGVDSMFRFSINLITVVLIFSSISPLWAE